MLMGLRVDFSDESIGEFIPRIKIACCSKQCIYLVSSDVFVVSEGDDKA